MGWVSGGCYCNKFSSPAGCFQDRLNLLEVLLFSGVVEVISIDEAAPLSGKWLVVGVDFEEEGGQYTALR